jgi:signal transduction histidine kinase
VGNGISERVEIWGTVVVRTMAVGFLVAAVAADPQLGRHPVTRRPIRRGLLVTAAAGLAAFALLVWLAPSGRGGLLGDPGGTDVLRSALQGLDAVLAFVASYLLARRATARSDPFLGWIATGCVFFGFAMISYALLPAGDSDWLRSGDLLRAAALATWAIGAVCEILSYWSTISDGARHEARRSVALDLHDGLAQELALLATSMHAPPDERSQPQWHEQAHRTAERALAEARRAIAALVADEALPLRADLEQTAESVSGSDVDVHVQIGSGAGAASLDPFQREAIVRIVREAVTNAVRHGGARHIDIQFGEEGSPALRVCDDGLGFELDRVGGPGHFGLVSMQEMAASLGASLAVHSEPEHGTTVEVLWP